MKATTLGWGAAIAGFLFFGLYLFAVQTSQGQDLDNEAYAEHIVEAPSVQRDADEFLRKLTDVFAPLVAALFVLTSLFRRRPALALGIIVLMGAGAGLPEFFKWALPRPEFFVDDPISFNSYPSGNAAVGAAVSFSFLLVAGVRWRRTAAVFTGLFLAFDGWAIVATGMHRPSDVLGSFLLVFAIAALVASLLARFFGTDNRPLKALSHSSFKSDASTWPLLIFAVVMVVLVGIVVIGHFGTLTAGEPEADYLAGVGLVVFTAFILNWALAKGLDQIALDRPQDEQPWPDDPFASSEQPQ